MQVFPPPGLWPGTAATAAGCRSRRSRIYPTGSFLDVLAFRLRDSLFAALHVYIFPRTIGLFLLGAFAWRTGILRNPQRHLLLSIAAACIGLGAALILCHAGGLIAGAYCGRPHPRPGRTFGTILLALGYGAAIIGIANCERKLLGWAAPLGRWPLPTTSRNPLSWLDLLRLWSRLFGRLGVTSAGHRFIVYFVQVPFSAWWSAATDTAPWSGYGAR